MAHLLNLLLFCRHTGWRNGVLFSFWFAKITQGKIKGERYWISFYRFWVDVQDYVFVGFFFVCCCCFGGGDSFFNNRHCSMSCFVTGISVILLSQSTSSAISLLTHMDVLLYQGLPFIQSYIITLKQPSWRRISYNKTNKHKTNTKSKWHIPGNPKCIYLDKE